MNVNESENIVKRVQEGILGAEDGAKMLMEIIYSNRKWFGLYKLDLDQTHDFLLAVYPKLIRLFSIYNPELGNFVPFFYASISSALATWRRKIVRMNVGEESVTLCNSMNVEESYSQYNELEFASCENEDSSYEIKAASPQFKLSNSRRKIKKSLLSASDKKELQKKEMCLCLALKSSYFMDEALIEKVSKLVELPSSELRKMIEQMNAQLSRKIARRECCIRKRDAAFFYHRKYILEMSRLNSDTSLSENIKKSFAKQTKCWIEKNNILKNAELRISPSNRAIGEVLGISPRHVEYLLKKSANNIDNLALKLYYKEHENLFSEREQKQKA